MSNWKRRGSVGICLWSLLLALLGVSQLIFGAYYVSKLPVFKIGSPVWVGFLNILCATGLFGLHHQTLELRRYWCRNGAVVASASSAFVYGYGAGNGAEEGAGLSTGAGGRKWPRLRRLCRAVRLSGPGKRIGRLYASLCLSLVVVLINLAHAVICEVGEWQHWLTVAERTQLRASQLNQLALQAHHVTSAQMSGSIILGILCASFTVWMMYRHQRDERLTGGCLDSTRVKSDKSAAGSASASSSLTSEPGAGAGAATGSSSAAKKSTASSDGASSLQISFDNPNWVYGESERVQLNPSGQGKAAAPAGRDSPFLLMKTYRIPRASISVVSDTVPIRHATIRRAPSIIHSLPDNFSSMRDQLRSSSFRTVRSERPRAALVQRSQTFKETTFTGRSFDSNLSFAQRFQPNEDSRDALSFVHDGRDIREIRDTDEEEARQEEQKSTDEEEKPTRRVTSVQTSRSDLIEEEDEDQEEEDREEEIEPRVNRTVRNTDRIILRVESFRTLPPSIPSRFQERGSPICGPTPRPGTLSRVPTQRSAPRVSCSTQTELSSLKSSNSGGSTAATHEDRSLPSYHQATPRNGEPERDKMAAPSGEMQLSPVESSSGYSSPRGTESKSPTPEPFSADRGANVAPGKANNSSGSNGSNNNKPHINVTVIQIEPNRDNSRLATDTATYAVPRKRSERGQLVPVMKPSSPATAQTPVGAFRVSIQSKSSAPVSRSVSFHHQQQHTSRKSVYNEWLYPYGHPQAQHAHHPPSMIPIPIPRPVLRTTSHRSTPPPAVAGNYGRRLALRDGSTGEHNMTKLSRSASTVGRSTSVHVAMSEIQRKLDLLQMVGANLPAGAASAPGSDLVPVHAPSSPLDPHGSHDPRDIYSLPGRPVASSAGHRRKSRKSSASPSAALMPVSPVADLSDGADSAETLAYLSELEMLARYWRTQLMYKVEMKASGKRHHHTSSGRDGHGGSSHSHHLERDTFQC